MISIIKKLPNMIIGFKYEGKVTAKDFEGFKVDALIDDAKLGIKYFRNWKKIAFVSNKKKMNDTVRTFGFLIPGQVKTFKKKKEAILWLSV